tara:strand:+ start:1201 stop:1929 length:729 start_codon:yes stop_codon:yes gene_type:complete
MEKRQLKVANKAEFLKLLDAISKINDSGVILDLKKDKITSLVSSVDSTLILCSEYKTNLYSFESSLNIPDVKKLRNVLDTIEDTDISLDINSNNLEYKGSSVKFKYHLFEEGFITRPNINLEKINAFKYDVEFKLNKNTLQRLFKGSTFASETNKIYFYTEGDNLMAELTDRSRHNTDNFTLSLGKTDINLKPTPVNLDNIRLLSIINDEFNVKVNTEFGVVIFDIEDKDIKLKYIISALTQ